MQTNYKILTILFLSLVVNKIYASYNNNQSYKKNYYSHNNSNSIFSKNSAFITEKKAREQKLQKQTFNAINEGYQQRLKNQDYTTVTSSIIAIATQKAQSMAIYGYSFSQSTIYEYCKNEGYPIDENRINNYLHDTQNEPSNFKDVLKKAYKSALF